MTSIAHKNMPSGAIMSAGFGLDTASETFTSPLSRVTQVGILSGGMWRARYDVKPLDQVAALEWKAFLISLKGRGGVFYGYDPLFRSYQGLEGITSDPSAWTADTTAWTADTTAWTADIWSGDVTSPGSPYVREANQSGEILKTGGWLPGLRLNAGEYAAFDFIDGSGATLRALHMLTDSITVGADGNVNLTVAPVIRISPALGAVIETAFPGCSMRLIDDKQARWDGDAALFTTITFEAEQVITAAQAGAAN